MNAPVTTEIAGAFYFVERIPQNSLNFAALSVFAV
jgi:hypothetical protein